MKKIKLFMLNAAGLSAVNITLRFVAVSFNAYVAAKIGAESMGLFSLVMSVYGLAVVVATSGVNLASVRLTAEKHALLERRGAGKDDYRKCSSSVIRSCVLYGALFSALTSAVLFFLSRPVGVYLLGDVRCVKSLKVLALSLLPISLSSAVSGYFTGVRKVYKNAVTVVTEQAVKIAITSAALTAAIPAGADAVEYACLAVVGGSALAEGASLALNVLLYVFDSKVSPGTVLKNNSGGCRASFGEVASISLPTAVGSYARQGLITAEHLAIPWGLKKNGSTSRQALASYGVLQGMVFPLILFPAALLTSFAGLLIPEFAEMRSTEQPEKIKRAMERVVTVSVLFSVCVSAVFILFSRYLGLSIYKSGDAARHILIIAPLIPVMYLDSAVYAMLKGLGAQLDSMRINVIDAATSLVLVLILVPRFGIWGYVAVIYVCEILNDTLSIIRLLRITGARLRVTRIVLIPLVSAVSSLGALFLVTKLSLPFPPDKRNVILMLVFISFYALAAVLLTRKTEKRVKSADYDLSERKESKVLKKRGFQSII